MNKHTPTEENKQRTKSLAAAGMPKEAIANMLEISVPTLREYYAIIMAIQDFSSTASAGLSQL